MDGDEGDRSGESTDKWGGLEDVERIVKIMSMFGANKIV